MLLLHLSTFQIDSAQRGLATESSALIERTIVPEKPLGKGIGVMRVNGKNTKPKCGNTTIVHLDRLRPDRTP